MLNGRKTIKTCPYSTQFLRSFHESGHTASHALHECGLSNRPRELK